jgi:hypothetical protein
MSTTNNQCWSRGQNCSGNVVIGCYSLPSLSCRGYLINMSNMFDVLFIRLCIQPPLLGRLLGCQKLTSWRYLWFLSFLLLCGYLMERYFYRLTCCWGSLLGASTSYIPLAWKRGYSCGLTASWTSCCGASNSNYLQRPLVITLDILQKSLIQIFFWSTSC